MNEAVRIRDMPSDAFGALLRSIGAEVGRLAARGDNLARKVVAAYMYAHDHKDDAGARMTVRVAVEDYINRDLRVGEQYDLGSKFGHRLPEPEKEHGLRIVVPEPILKQ